MTTRISATQSRVSRLLAGRHQARITMRVKLTGRAGEAWLALLAEAERLHLQPEDVAALLLDEAQPRVLAALQGAR
jgi:hypothetical protein